MALTVPEYLGRSVLEEAVARMEAIYAGGHRIVVSFSAGKDSTCCMEVCLEAARRTGRLPIEVMMRDEEIMYPGTYEYAERVSQRKDIQFHWLYARQPIINVFNRIMPYWWVFDPQLSPDAWVRKPPPFAREIANKNIESIVIPERFPAPPGKHLYAVIGLRVEESNKRRMGLYNTKGYITQPNRHGVRNLRPIYDWTDGDVWKAIHDNRWDYNNAYDVMHRLGLPRRSLRIAPPTIVAAGAPSLAAAARAWPRWFDRVCKRLPGVRTVAQFGLRAVRPVRRLGETWQQTFMRECIEEPPAPWIRERAEHVLKTYMGQHAKHSTAPFPEVNRCYSCTDGLGSWKLLTLFGYGGDPFSMKFGFLPYIEPEFFRKGAGTWDGKPQW